MKLQTLLLAVVAVVTAIPREKRQVAEDCLWFEDCSDTALDNLEPTTAHVEQPRTPRSAQAQNQTQGQISALADTYDKCNSGKGSCVPYYLCKDGDIVTDGAGLFDIR